MCGLAVMLGLNRPADAAVLSRMAQAIAHRGPDDSGLYLDGPVGFGFRRLSILDLSPAGHQPMSGDDGQLVIVFNGEIYNYVELRKELRAAGYRFQSSSDTEVLLAAYRHWGSGCLSRLNGMWAFVIHDRRRGVLFGARDRFGVKPLFVHHGRDHWLLASEIKAILASGLYQRATNWQVAADFLAFGRLEERPATFFADVESVPPGFAFELRLDGAWTQWRYWSLPDREQEPVPHLEDTVAALLEDAVRIRLRSDVPVGVCLSGGLDSTAVTCAMARNGSRPLAFCYHEPAFDERPFIGDTLEQTGAELRRITLSPEATWDTLTEVLQFQDEPIHSGAPIAGYHLMKLAAQSGVKVVLNGQGADEVFAGYSHYFNHHWYTLLGTGRAARAWQEIRAYAGGHRQRAGRLFLSALGHLVHHQLRRFAPYRDLAGRRKRWRLEREGWFNDSFFDQIGVDDRVADADLDPALRRSVTRAPLPLFLRIEDRNSMAHGVEVRLPFLDYRLVSLAFRVPSDLKLSGMWNKALLRESLRGRIPESVRSRVDKMGFPTSLHTWTTGILAAPIRDILSSRAARERGIYRVDRLLRALRNGRQTDPWTALRLFYVAQFELWQELHRPAPAGAAPAPADRAATLVQSATALAG
jgi:asparagine synthase (glutamine-hydrolysing)